MIALPAQMPQVKRKSQPPPLRQRPRVEVWEYLGDGLWTSLGHAFPQPMTDPFWVILARVCPWWPEGHASLASFPRDEESGYTPLPANA
jgi:hypothetical protein